MAPAHDEPWSALVGQALERIAAAEQTEDIERTRVHYLGRNGVLTQALRDVGRLPPEQRPAAGQLGNAARNRVTAALQARQATLAEAALARRLAAEAVDVTLPGRRPAIGHAHPLRQLRTEIETIFASLGFTVAEGPEVESEWYNFEALNMPADHPARAMHDSFYLDLPPGPEGRLLLRTHTSPVQMRHLQALGGRLPVRMLAPGRVYRRDDDATHSPMFHQVEGLAVDRDLGMPHLKGTLAAFARQLWGPAARIRLRPSYFPFTEPSAEVDVSCVFCGGGGCRTCKESGWIEILGAGLVHPRVLAAGGYDPEAVSGFAFGVGLERVAMLHYRIPDLRLLFEGDLRLLEQF